LKLESVEELLKGSEVVLMGQTNVRMIDFLSEQVRGLEKGAQAKLKVLPEYERLEQIPGLGRILNLVIMLETGPIERFATAGNYVSYCRAVQAEKLSNERKKGETASAAIGTWPGLGWKPPISLSAAARRSRVGINASCADAAI
jgi:hypothetical protein